MTWVACEQDQGLLAPSGDTTLEPSAKPAPNAAPIATVMAVQERHTDRLLVNPHVVGTATGLGPNGKHVVLVFTRGADASGIPKSLDGVRVIARVTGEFRALEDPTARQPRPVPFGVSTGHPAITAGTIGCRLTDGTDVYALSNNHVYADENNASIGDNALQPGPFDGGMNPGDAIGTLKAFIPIRFGGRTNFVDAAVALSSTALLGTSTLLGGYGTPKSTTTTASIGIAVQKYGRTTGQTSGTVTGVNATVWVGYDSGVARFRKQFIIEPGGFSEGGDSGSLIVVDGGSDDRKPVGLLFAGSSTHTIANPIDQVLQRLGDDLGKTLSIDGEGGEPPPPPPPPPPPGDAPSVTGCDPGSGDPGRQLTVMVTGADFQDGATADFGDKIAVKQVTFMSSMQLDVKIRIHRRATSGARNVSVTNPDGQSGTGTDCFSVN